MYDTRLLVRIALPTTDLKCEHTPSRWLEGENQPHLAIGVGRLHDEANLF